MKRKKKKKNAKHQTICIRFANESSTIVGKTIESGSKPHSAILKLQNKIYIIQWMTYVK